MGSQRNSGVITTAVYLGGVILVGWPATILVYEGLGLFVKELGFGQYLAGIGAGILLLISVLLGLQLAVEAAMVQLHGVAAIGRGSRRTALLRQIIVAVAVLIVLLGTAFIGLLTAVSVGRPDGLFIGSLLFTVAVITLYRAVSELVRGWRSYTTE